MIANILVIFSSSIGTPPPQLDNLYKVRDSGRVRLRRSSTVQRLRSTLHPRLHSGAGHFGDKGTMATGELPLH